MAVKINLLDWRTELTNFRQQQFMAMLGLGFVVAAGSVFMVTVGVQGAIDHQRERNAFLTNQIAEMDKKIKEIEELEKVKANLLARMKVIEELQASRFLHAVAQNVRDIHQRSPGAFVSRPTFSTPAAFNRSNTSINS